MPFVYFDLVFLGHFDQLANMYDIRTQHIFIFIYIECMCIGSDELIGHSFPIHHHWDVLISYLPSTKIWLPHILFSFVILFRFFSSFLYWECVCVCATIWNVINNWRHMTSAKFSVISSCHLSNLTCHFFFLLLPPLQSHFDINEKSCFLCYLSSLIRWSQCSGLDNI